MCKQTHVVRQGRLGPEFVRGNKVKPSNHSSQTDSAFTLIELLLVIAIIAILASLLFTTISGVRQRVRMLQCQSNMRQLRIACGLYALDSDQRLPTPTYPPGLNPMWAIMEAGLKGPQDPVVPIHAEAGSIFPYMGGRRHVGSSSPTGWAAGLDFIEPDLACKDSFELYRCPNTGLIGKTNRVTYSISMYFFGTQPNDYMMGIHESRVINPAKKAFLTDKTIEDALPFEQTWNSGGVAHSITRRFFSIKQIRHRRRFNIAWADGHLDNMPATRARIISDSEALRQEFLYPLGTWP